MSIKSLIINPGSTSTKIGVFEDETLLFDTPPTWAASWRRKSEIPSAFPPIS